MEFIPRITMSPDEEYLESLYWEYRGHEIEVVRFDGNSNYVVVAIDNRIVDQMRIDEVLKFIRYRM